MKKRILLAMAAAVLTFGLAGCGENQIPDLTEEQSQAIGEFTAFTLMRYDANHRSRLVDYTLLMASPEPTPDSEPEPTQKPAGMDPVDDTPVIGIGGNTASDGNIADTLGLPAGVNITFLDQAVYNIYPEGDEYFVMTAAEGKKLLVLRFSITNSSEQDQSVDVLHTPSEFRVTVNGEFTRRALLTGLESDLSTFQSVIATGGSTTAVLVIEADESVVENITSLSVNVKNDSKSCTIRAI